MKDLRPLHYFLGIEVSFPKYGMFLSQQKHATDLLLRAPMHQCKPTTTPIAPKQPYVKNGDVPFHDPTYYRSIVGGLQYLTLTRPDLSLAVKTICQHMHAPTIPDFINVKRILRYIRGTIHLGLRFLSHSSLDLFAFIDIDWA